MVTRFIAGCAFWLLRLPAIWSALWAPALHLPHLISGSLLFNVCVFVSSPSFIMSGRTKKQKLQNLVRLGLCLTHLKLRTQHGSCLLCLKWNTAGQVAWVSTGLPRGCGVGGGHCSDYKGRSMEGRGSGGRGGLGASKGGFRICPHLALWMMNRDCHRATVP